MANRLQFETSPYLLQHAHNPVDWYPWGQEALERAKAENKVILISIGYSACHWCHVMERESFEDPATADLMNQHFVNIKLDREERPDLDNIYMDALQAISGSGGWPLNVFLTPEAKPFYGGTYFPPVRAYNRSSWQEVLQAIATSWQQKPHEIIAQAENLTAHLQSANMFGSLKEGAVTFTEETLSAVAANMLKSADKVWGGFGNAPKFPQTMSIGWLLRQYHYYSKDNAPRDLPFSQEELLQQALLSLDKMIAGGIYDHLGGGFARYSTDIKWLAPHFEKMLYDNALLLGVLSEAYQLTGIQRYKSVIDQTMAFVAREWQSLEGGFYSALDADSEGVEGKYYTWSQTEIFQVLENEVLAGLFCTYYNVSEAGNWEHTNILWEPRPFEVFANEMGYNPDQLQVMFDQAKCTLLAYREKRIRPQLDDKKLLGWNALMITACVKAGNATGNREYLQMARHAASFIEQFMKNDNGAGVYCHNEKNGKAHNPAFLDDLAYYIEALCHLQEATGEAGYLETARAITEMLIRDFSDSDSPYFFFTPVYQQDIIVRKKETYDGATPAGNSVMAINLLYLGILLDEPTWTEKATLMLAQLQNTISRYPNSFGNWAQAIQWKVYGLQELAVVGERAGELAADILKMYLPNKILQQSNGDEVSNYPLLINKPKENGQTLIYACKNYTCQVPVADVEALFKTINRL